jgi:hypothetical protein
MTVEENKIYEAARAYVASPIDANLGKLITAVMDMPTQQWPPNTCAPPEHKPKRAKGPLWQPVVHRGPKDEGREAADPDKIIDLETGEKRDQ